MTQRNSSALSSIDRSSNPHGLVFVKSWNEWAEGNCLEPDRTSGADGSTRLPGELARHGAPAKGTPGRA